MAIYFIGGKPRGGKSLRAVQRLLNELRHGKRNIVTNLALDLDEIQMLMVDEGRDVDVFARVTILDQEQVAQFYRYRGSGLVLGLRYIEKNGHPVTDKEGRPIIDPQQPLEIDPSLAHAVCSRGVVYFLDELHIYFNSRKWKDTGDMTLWYLSQHAKLGDDVWCITQSIANVDKQFRSVAQEFHYVRNFSKEKFGMFKMGDFFEERVFMQPASGANDTASSVEKFRFDKSIGKCYFTSGGVGVPSGGVADIGKKAKGIPVWSLWVLLGLGFCGIWYSSKYVPRLLEAGIGVAQGTGKKAVAGSVPAGKPASVAPSPITAPPMPAAPVIDAGPVDVSRALPRSKSSDVYPTGVVSRGDVLFVQMSDGTRRWVHRNSGDSDAVSLATPSSVTIDGQKLYIRAGERPAEAAPRYFPRPIWKGRDKNGEFEAPYQNAGSPVLPPPPPDVPMKFDTK